MARFPSAITRELGGPGLGAVGGFVESFEEAPDLQWPANMVVYDRMRRSDGQVTSILRAIGLPIRRNSWRVVGQGVRPEVIAFVEAELGLNQRGTGRRRRRRQGVTWAEFLSHVLLMLPFGHSVFEQVYVVGPPQPDLADRLPPQVAHLRKLGPRLPRTITGWDVARDGGLEGIRQIVPAGANVVSLLSSEVRIPVDRLAVFCNEREGSDWAGQSILRGCYKNWLIKDLLLRLGPMAVERNGMGVPVVNYPAGGDEAKAIEFAKAFRTGETAGGALEEGYRLELVGVTGQVRDELPLVKYHDEAIGRSVLAMFLNLGHDNGARSLGDTFVDYFALSLGAVVENIVETVTEYVIRDLVELNFGEDEPYPELVGDEIAPDSPLTAEALKDLVEAGVVHPDAELEVDVRRRFRLPPPGTPFPAPPGGPSADDGVITDVDPAAPAPAAPANEPPGAPRNPGPGGSPTNPDTYPDGSPLRPPAGASAPRETLDELQARLALATARLEAARAAR